MEDWDQETLEKVVASKNKEYQQNKPTDIVNLLCPAAFDSFFSFKICIDYYCCFDLAGRYVVMEYYSCCPYTM